MYVGTGLSGPIAVSGVDGSLDEDLPTKGQVKAGYDYYLSLTPDKFTGDDMSPGAAVKWNKRALSNYVRREGITKNAHVDAAIAIAATSNNGTGFNPYSTSYAEYALALGEMTGAAGNQYYGVAAEVGAVTVDTVRDGKITEAEAEKIGQATGAIVGGVLAQSVGVPAPIGALVGGKLGGGAASMIHNAFAGADLQKRAQDLAKQARAEVERFRSDAVQTCRALESYYWKDVDAFYRKYAESWTEAERNIGWRFQLRWFDPNPGLAFRYGWDKSKLEPATSRRTDTLGYDYDCGTSVVVHSGGEERVRICKFKCPYVFGCPYPNLGSNGVPGQIVEAALTDDAQRVSQALAARGVLWLPPSQRIDCSAYIKPVPGGNLATNAQVRDQYRASVQTQLNNLVTRAAEFERARVFLQADLVRTVTLVSAEKDLYMRRAEYLTDGWKKGSYEEALASSVALSRVLNTTVFAAGAGLLGYGIWRALR